jgi:PII-like signaling protein
MPNTEEARLLRIHITENDRFGGRPLYEAIVQRCRELSVAGATVLRGIEGYGATAEIHKSHGMSAGQPVIVIVVDSVEMIQQVLPAIEEMMDTGMIAASRVEVRRIRKGTA